MPRFVLSTLAGLCCWTAATAQDIAAGLAAAREHMAAQQWTAALELLLTLPEKAASDADRIRIADQLEDVSNALRETDDFEATLRGQTAALALRQLVHGDRDDLGVATNLNNAASCHRKLGRPDRALPLQEEALAMLRRLNGDGDDEAVATALNNVALTLEGLSKSARALPLYEESLAMRQRLHDGDHPDVAQSLDNRASCLESLGRWEAALQSYETALAMRRRLCDDADDPDVAESLNNLAYCLESMGNLELALRQYEEALAMRKRLIGDRDHPMLAMSINNVAACMMAAGRVEQAFPMLEGALSMQRRLCGNRDHPSLAMALNNVGNCLETVGQPDRALPYAEAALAMQQRLHGQEDHVDVAHSMSAVAFCLVRLGQADRALPHFEAGLVMLQRIYGDTDHHEVAFQLGLVAFCLLHLEQPERALPLFQQALAMQRHQIGDRDHPAVAHSLENTASCLKDLGQRDAAMAMHADALAMQQRIYGGHDHEGTAACLNNMGTCLLAQGKPAEAIEQVEAALAMGRRMYGDRDHGTVVTRLNNLAACRESLGQFERALAECQTATRMSEHLWQQSRVSGELRQSYFDHLKRSGTFERLQALAIRLNRPAEAMAGAERSRARELLDLLEQQRFDPLEEAILRARQRTDTDTAQQLAALRTNLEAANLECDRLLRLLARLADDSTLGEDERLERRQHLVEQSDVAGGHRRRLLDERARLVAEVLPVGQVRSPAEIQAVLQEGELLLEFTVTEDARFLYVVSPDGEVQTLSLPPETADAERVRSVLPGLAYDAPKDRRGRDPDDNKGPGTAMAAARCELFQKLIPADLWVRLRAARRVFIAPHRALHRLPFELLVTEMRDGAPVYWLDVGPEVAYVQSGSALHWLRRRARTAPRGDGRIDLLAVGDPTMLKVEPQLPETGVYLLGVNADGEAARVGLRPGDVLLAYDGTHLADDGALRALLALERDGTQAPGPVDIEVWRRGETMNLSVASGPLGVRIGRGGARAAFAGSLDTVGQVGLAARAGDVERLSRLPPLSGARAETEQICAVFAAQHAGARRLLGKDATEAAVFEHALGVDHLHFACHGIAEEYAGQSLSMLVLAQPHDVLPGDDGLLKLGDLLHAWRGRLDSCQLVVLSACRTNVGPTMRDEAPQALPIGFLFAGARSVISSLWAVDDDSTRELMTDFYGRLLAGETDKLRAFTAARKALRAKYADPFHWAPFLFVGAPE